MLLIFCRLVLLIIFSFVFYAEKIKSSDSRSSTILSSKKVLNIGKLKYSVLKSFIYFPLNF